MEEETGVKVTRLRRRLSVEADDVKSPSTQSTPTKKRGGRLAAKPQLELIDENATELNKPKRTRKSIVRDAEPEEKTVTPSRRSTRIRSNTSLVSETPIEVEDKGTPAKRNTRIKSNTSIVSETAQHVDSPRARRAARRTSLVVSGSDNEASATPVRSTRRTRKESTSSIDKQELNPDKLETQIKEVITEEPENTLKDTTDGKTPTPKDTNQSFTTRKSPRFKEKIFTSSSPDNNKRDDSALVKEVNHEKSNSNQSSPKVIASKIPVEINLSASTSNLIKQLGTQPKKGHSNLNKTTSAVETQSKSKRNRTKSWSAVPSTPANDNNFLSDTEVIGRKKNGDNAINRNNKIIRKSKEQTEMTDILSRQEEKKCNDKSLSENVNTSTKLDKSTTKDKRLSNNILKIEVPEKDLNFTEKFFGEAPKGIVRSSVYIEDSDSNAGNTEQKNLLKGTANEDQCVPVVEHQFKYQISKETENNLSCEPMDIDETMPENVSLLHYLDKSDVSGKNSALHERKSFTSISIGNDSINVTGNKSQRKSSVSNLENDTSNNQEVITAASTDNPAENHINDCKRKSSLSAVDVTDESEAISRKSEGNVNDSLNKSKRKSSISSSVADDDKYNNPLNSSSINKINKSDLSEKGINNINDSSNKTRKRSTTSPNKSTRKSLGIVTNENEVNSPVDNNDAKNVSLNKSKRKSSIAKTSDCNIDHNSSKSNEETIGFDKNSDKSKRKSYNSKLDLENSTSFEPNRSSNKSKRKSSISDMGSQIFYKSNNENKSTLVLSQIKDVSEDGVLKEVHELNESKNSNEQLSKSVTMPNRSKNKESDKKNLSLTYSTSTPLQQKPFKKLGIQINSSMITPNSTTKCENKRSSRKSQKETSMLSKTDASDSSNEEEREESAEEDEEELSEEESMNKSKMIDNEADEASEDYESGDSRDEDSVEYEEQHEIVEKGETLDSEDDDFSDDSEYEKGSFIVDSDEEDAALLSGSDDDLSMSADELNMSKKSKKKFNDRKAKEQKKASREMFAARHKLNESGARRNSNKKVNRQLSKSAESESDGEVGTLQKKNKRRRIDSSQDITMTESDHDVTLFKQKKVRKLSDSVCEENEKEISIRDNNATAKDDPLSLHNIVKEEPMTPKQDQNISKITNTERIHEIDVDNTNLSILQTNQTTDPLQASSIQDEAMNDSSEESISENEEITQNYESVLNNLNNKGNKIKSVDISLNLNKKNKQQIKEPIVDELNLTHPKKSKKGKQRNNKEKSSSMENAKKANKSINIQEEGSSDSIDMKLLFNDDSTDNEVKASTENKTVVEEFIPLKRTKGKTNILRSTEFTSEGQNELVQHIKKMKHKASDLEETVADDIGDGDVNFFIDTTGTHTEMNDSVKNTSIKSSAEKNKKKDNRFSTDIENNKNDDDSSDGPLEISYHSDKNNKSKQDLNVSQAGQKKAVTVGSKTPTSAKKNKKGIDKNLTIVQYSDDDSNDHPQEISYHSDKNDKSKQELNISQTEVTKPVNIGSKTPISAKKNKKSIDKNLTVQHSDDDSSDHPQEISYHSDKNNKSKQELNISQTEVTKPVNIGSKTPKSAKKKKKSIDKNLSIVQHSDDDYNDHPQEISYHSDENNKSKQEYNVSQIEHTQPVVIGSKTPTSTKKNKKSIDNTLTIVQHSEIKAVIVEKFSSKKQKRKLSANKTIEKEKDDDVKTEDGLRALSESLITMNPKKKRKVSHTIDIENIESKEKLEEEQSATKKPKKKKTTPDSNPMDDLPKKSKKRKEREDDDGEMLSKVTKQNSFDKVHVPRLPTNVLNQLDVKPKKHEKDIISTTSFTVEGIRQKRNKPSNYLEQSVYLNDSLEDTASKKRVKAPKVLPFIPTASTSDCGFTTHFTVNVLPQEIKFVAQSSDVSNFKNDRLQKNRIQKLGTFEKYKRHRSIKISKF